MTAVEWLEKAYSNACYNNMTHNIQISKDFIPNIILKAKEMEKKTNRKCLVKCLEKQYVKPVRR